MPLCAYGGPLDKGLGRPLPDDPVPSTEDATDRVLARLRSSPWAAGVAVDGDRVRELVERRYTGVAPWPFGALFDRSSRT